ncbi:putative P-loop containing nucleoside triphosphate hydrolase [Helianthus annuus]|uniref:P-loop containing nucleoside triphosphate hydrolase n=1 Tax=Helianthus annuus TaxID=4232 RepID=A0A251VDM6_HELAN|nr:protein ROOT HAIR DEFECTIVE 3 [Helianthus annuus]KAF5817823.1 putative P-loop containing nucleoside triphosphate hydrolase [Helianthus annuus]KAJ0618259.1 putative P-loop containing nucleoside triphosphate hydrolase [Helianthus annuus]KAJ0776720.1 putative P-loop containing nucleoside triphosphate hydrolase [Helianthus annuus]KAJ0951182.1 putative P-loop containing nucleoside triphosphate hydrolase [Helianthus annuus]
MEKEAESYTTQLIAGDGTFNADGLDNFIKQVKLEECGRSYAVVAVMGPQSSGKSTLLNLLFHTKFREMDASMGRNQTTQGIWIARCTRIEPCTIVMDIEGTDGQERGEDDTAFEKQSALFGIAVSDIVIINMWCNDIGREQAANKPLLKTVFKVMLRIGSPRKTTLMFVIRDKTTKTSHEILESKLRTEIRKIWDSVPKPEAHKYTHMSKFFNVEVELLSHYEYQEKQFMEEVADLRLKFNQSIAPGGLNDDRRGVVPASGFSDNAQNIWKQIKENKDLDLPSQMIMVSTIRCEKILEDNYSSFVVNYKDWLPGFGKKLSSLLENCLSNYDQEAMGYDAKVVSEKRKQLEEKVVQHVLPVYKLMFEQIQFEAVDNFKIALKDALDEKQGFAQAARNCKTKSVGRFKELCEDANINQANWDSAKMRDKLSHDLDQHIAKVRTVKIDEITTLFESELKEGICTSMEARFEEVPSNLWHEIRNHLSVVNATIVSTSYIRLSEFEMDQQEITDVILKLNNYVKRQVEMIAKTEAGKVLGRMKKRFEVEFNHDENTSMPRQWTKKDDMFDIFLRALGSSITLLILMTAIQLDDDNYDSIKNELWPILEVEGTNTALLPSSTWEKIPAADTLITPFQSKLLWDQFKSEIEYIINNAVASKKAYSSLKAKLGRAFSNLFAMVELGKMVLAL